MWKKTEKGLIIIQQKHYLDIERLKPNYLDAFSEGDEIVIQEKIDGANFSIRYDAESDNIKAFSRRKELNETNTLRGAWNWSQTLDKELIKTVLGSNLILFMEWLVPHTVKYPDDKYHKAYCYDVYDTNIQQYLKQTETEKIVKELNLTFVPVFYRGRFTSWDDVKTYIGKTQMGGEYGEGVVVKNQTTLNNPNTRLPFYVKLVCEQFCETKGHKQSHMVDTDALAKKAENQRLVSTVVTKARVRKLIHKMVDNGVIPENWSNTEMRIIAKNIGKDIYYDCLKEEKDVVEMVGHDFGKFAHSSAMRLAREILSERELSI